MPQVIVRRKALYIHCQYLVVCLLVGVGVAPLKGIQTVFVKVITIVMGHLNTAISTFIVLAYFWRKRVTGQ